jgi:hypothetical protein
MYALRPSKASTWVLCAASVLMEAMYPEQPGDNEIREEGTAGHWAAYEIGNGRPVPVGTVAPNGVTLDDEILDGVLTYLNHLFSFALPVYLEAPVEIPRIHKQCGGTVDAWIWDSVKRLLRVADLKLGYRQVDPFENWQLLAYLCGIITRLGLTEHFDFELIIVQPRAYGHPPIKTWRGNSTMLAPYFKKLQEKATHAAVLLEHGEKRGAELLSINNYGPAFLAGPHCDGCSARGHCDTALNAAMAVVDLAGDKGIVEHSIIEVSNRLRRLYRAQQTLEAVINGLEHRVEHEITENHALVPCFEVSHGNGKWVWKEGVEAQVIATGQLLGVTLAKPVKPITVVQARAALKNVTPGLLEPYAERQPGKLKLRMLPENQTRKTFEV